MATALERRLALIVDVVGVDVTHADFAHLHRVVDRASVGLVETNRAGAVVVIHLRLELPVNPAVELLLTALPHFTDSDVIGEIRLHVQECAFFDEVVLREQDSIINFTIRDTHCEPLFLPFAEKLFVKDRRGFGQCVTFWFVVRS